MQTVCVRLRHCEEKSASFSHIHILFCIKGLKKKTRPYCMWLCIPEGKPTWQVKILRRESHYQSNEQNKTIQTRVKTWQSESHWQKILIGSILKLEKSFFFSFFFKKILKFGSHSIHLCKGQFIAIQLCNI